MHRTAMDQCGKCGKWSNIAQDTGRSTAKICLPSGLGRKNTLAVFRSLSTGNLKVIKHSDLHRSLARNTTPRSETDGAKKKKKTRRAGHLFPLVADTELHHALLAYWTVFALRAQTVGFLWEWVKTTRGPETFGLWFPLPCHFGYAFLTHSRDSLYSQRKKNVLRRQQFRGRLNLVMLGMLTHPCHATLPTNPTNPT